MVMMMLTTTTKMASEWGTWEELLLGGAVIRYGTGDWTVVSEELRSHSLSEIFTPEICKAKYKDLRERYLGCKAWFEELKKKRVAELKAALLKSEDSIGSLESKLQSLKSENNENDYDSSRTLSLEPFPKSEGGGECTSKDTSKDLSSVGSFTQQELTTPNWSPQAKSEEVKEQDKKKKKNLLHGDIFESMYGLGVGGQVLPSMRKKRGKRKRKDCSTSKDVTEVSAMEESDMLDSSTVAIASNSRSKEAASTSRSRQIRGHGLALPEELMKIYNTISQNECALVFRRRLDSQKRARYKKLVRRHMDLDTIKSRINGRSISSAKELFMDFLLVANNAATFYSKNTRAHKSAVCLREIVTKCLRHYLTEDNPPSCRSSNISTNTKFPVPSSTSKSPSVRTSVAVKRPRTGAYPHKKVEQEDMAKTTSSGCKKRRIVTDSPVAAVKLSAAGKKGMAVEEKRRRRGRDGNKQVSRGLDSPALAGRKRNRVR